MRTTGKRTAKLTQSVIDRASPSTVRYVIWDTDVKGYGLRVEPSGHKSFIVRYRAHGGGRTAPMRQMVLKGQGGRVLTATSARKLAKEALGAVANGGDPAADRALRRKQGTVAEVLDRYLAEHVASHNKPSTGAEARRQVERVIKPALGSIKIGDLSRSHIKRWHASLAHKPYDGNRALAYLRKALSLAHKEWELRGDNPAIGIKMFPEARRERFFSDAELTRIGEALGRVEAEGGIMPGCFAAVRLLALTGMRLGEVLGLRWDYLDLAEGCVRLPSAKAGARTVPLGTPVLAYLSELPQSGKYVCEAIDPEKPLHLKTFRRFWKRLSERAGLINARPHDFRHTAGTYVAQGGANAFVVRDVLGHKTMAMTARYVAKSIDPLRAATDQFSGRVAAAMDGNPSAGGVRVGKGK